MQNDLFEAGRGAVSSAKAGAEARRNEFILNARKAMLARVLPDSSGLELVQALPELNGEQTIILNAETTGLRWWDRDKPIGWSWWLPESGRSGYTPLRHCIGDNVDPEAFRRWARSLKGVRYENINSKFDLHMAEEDGAPLREICDSFGDAAHRAALLDDNRFRFNLDQLSKDELGWDVTKDGLGKLPLQITNETEFQYLHPGVVAPYAVRNVAQVNALLESYAPQIEDEELEDVLQLECDVLPAVVEFERNGLYLDVPLAEQWHREVNERLDAIRLKIYKSTGIELTSFDSSKQLQAIFERRGHRSNVLTPSGAPSFTDGVMKQFAAVDPVIADLRTGGQLADLNSKYLVKYLKLVDGAGWMRYNLHQLRTTRGEGDEGARGAVSGRFSAAGDDEGGFNPQQVVAVEKQLERGWCPDYVIRKLIVPGPGEIGLIASDMMQVEYRLFARYADDPAINAAYAGAPLQKLIGGKMVWVQGPLADFHALVAELLNQPHLNRKLVKNVNFALIYGAALIKFAYMLGMITEAQFLELNARLKAAMRIKDFSAVKAVYNDPLLSSAQDLLDTYHRMFPRVKPLMDKTKYVARERGYVKTLMGRRARLTDRFHSALNRIVQGGAADINKRAVVEVYQQRKQLNAPMRCTVHDEIVLGRRPETNVDAVDKVLNFQYYPHPTIPILWETRTGDNWAACK